MGMPKITTTDILIWLFTIAAFVAALFALSGCGDSAPEPTVTSYACHGTFSGDGTEIQVSDAGLLVDHHVATFTVISPALACTTVQSIDFDTDVADYGHVMGAAAFGGCDAIEGGFIELLKYPDGAIHVGVSAVRTPGADLIANLSCTVRWAR